MPGNEIDPDDCDALGQRQHLRQVGQQLLADLGAGAGHLDHRRHARINRHRGTAKAQVAIARFLPGIIWHILHDLTPRYNRPRPRPLAEPTKIEKQATTSASSKPGKLGMSFCL